MDDFEPDPPEDWVDEAASRQAAPSKVPNMQIQDQWGDFYPFPGSRPTFPPGSVTPRYVMKDGSIRKLTEPTIRKTR